jgi:hypothetical protein
MRKRRFNKNPVILSLPVLIAWRHNVDKNFFRLHTVVFCELNFYDAVVRNDAGAFELPARVHVSVSAGENR